MFGIPRLSLVTAAVVLSALVALSIVAGVSMCKDSSPDPKLSNPARLDRVLALYARYRDDFPQVSEVGAAELLAREGLDGVVFVDVRESREQAVSMLPGAVTAEAFEAEPERWAGKLAVGYCTISYRSGEFAERMAERGVKVVNLRGGMLAWALEGGKVLDSDGKPTRRIHTYGPDWAYVPQGWKAIY